jgi:hypothetical protein
VLLPLARTKANTGISQFADRLTAMIRDIEEALKPAVEGKRVLKGALAKKIEVPARFARTELENIALFIEPNLLNSTAARHEIPRRQQMAATR